MSNKKNASQDLANEKNLPATQDNDFSVDRETGEVIQYPDPLKPLSKIRTQLSYNNYPKKYEKNFEASKTTPNMTMTILEMIDRHRKGRPIDAIAKVPLYEGTEEPRADLEAMDLVDRQEYIDSVADALVEVRNRLQAAAKTKEESDLLKKVDEAVKAKVEQMQKEAQQAAQQK